jgi:hypothetical protein
MGLFEKMGREVEKFKQNAQEAAEEHKQETTDDGGDGGDGDSGDDHKECPVCIEQIPADATECPNCGTDLENYTEESVDMADIESDGDVELPDEGDGS